MTIDEHINYWLESAENDLNAGSNMMVSKNYDWALFLGHLVLEKTLKAIFVKKCNNEVPPKLHNLIRLKELSGVSLNENYEKFLIEANKFHIESRYPQYKQEFYKLCTSEYAHEKFKMINEVYQCLKLILK